MSNKVIEKIEKDQLKDHPEFRAGDTVEVKVKVTEGQRTRLQAFEGLVISVKKRGLNSAFIVRKISNGVGVERTFQTHSPLDFPRELGVLSLIFLLSREITTKTIIVTM